MAPHHELPLISTIAVGLSVAFVTGLIASKLRLSPIVGYLFAGFLIGPFTPGFVADLYLAKELSEIGIVLLMFGVGLHFSIDDLLEVKGIAVPGAIGQIVVAISMGVGLAYYWNWSIASGLLLGLALSVASTVVLLRALETHNTLSSVNGRIAIGWLIVEDLVMILALVMMPALVSYSTEMDSSSISGDWLISFGVTIGKIILFFLCMLVVGKRALPWILNIVSNTRSRELFTLAVMVVAIGIAFGASKLFGVSLALGAFFAGMMLKESELSHEVADRALPLQDAFAVLFFVSVGMLFNPNILAEEPLRVLAIVIVIMVGKSLAAFLIVLSFRYPIKTALMVSASLAQIGEFSFILANLGMHYHLFSAEAHSLILAGAMISIALNPLTFHGSNLFYNYIMQRPALLALFRFNDNRLEQLQLDKKQKLKDAVIVVGYGRVGRHVCNNIASTSIVSVVIDANRERVEELRTKGVNCICGDASHEDTLREAAIEKARAIIVAVPNPFEVRRIIETARKLKPNIRLIVRAINDEELEYYREQNVDLAVMGPREVARRMVDFLVRIKS